MDRAEHGPWGRSSAGKKSSPGSHLTDDLLLLAVDGELSPAEAALVRGHLEACWSCRVRQEQIQDAIAGVVEYRNRLVKPHLPRPAGSRSIFIASLRQYVDRLGRPSLWSRFVGGFHALRAVAVPARLVWISAVVLAGLVLFFFSRLQELPVVSASELLQQAQASETQARRSVSQPVVYQKLSIRVGAQSATRTIYRDCLGKRQADHLDASGTKLADLQRVFLTVHWNWQDPLSAVSFSAWRDGLPRKRDVVARDGKNLWTLKTTAPEGSVRKAELTVRARDYHPVAESLQLEDDRRIEITELAYEVLSLEAISPAIFAPEAPALLAIAQPAPAAVPSDAELAEAELQARLALHVTGADLGEQLEVVPKGHRSVVVRGLMDTENRKEELLRALEVIPHLELQLQTVEEAAANHLGPTLPQAPIAMAVEARPALQKVLEERFPSAEERVAFVNRALGLAQDAMAHAWALQRLQERYGPEEIASLSRSSQQTLELVIRDHVAALRQQADAETELITPLLPAVSDESPAPLPASADWRIGVREIFPMVEKMHGTVAALFAGSSGVRSDPEALAHDLRGTLVRLRVELTLLYQQLGGPFLKPIEEKP